MNRSSSVFWRCYLSAFLIGVPLVLGIARLLGVYAVVPERTLPRLRVLRPGDRDSQRAGPLLPLAAAGLKAFLVQWLGRCW